jgi:thiamine transport system substrate-binding protein
MRRCTMRRWVVTAVIAGVLGALVGAAPAGAKQPVTITLVTHDSFSVSKPVLRAFTKETGINVKVLPTGDAGAALNQVILTKDHPIGDALFGVDNTFLSRALQERIFVPYESPELTHVASQFVIDPGHHVTPVDHGDVCINYDKAWFREHGVARPTTLGDLTKPAYKGLLVVEDPSTSSPGLAFLLTTIAKLGAQGWRDYWRQLRDNDVKVVAGWEQAYNGQFSAGEGHGDRPLVVSYASSPPAAVYFADPRPRVSPVGTLLPSCFRQVETVGILRGTAHPKAARRLVDFMLSRRFQEDMPLQMFVFPVRDDARLPKVFERFADVPDHPYTLPPSRIGKHRERWIEQWTDTVLR